MPSREGRPVWSRFLFAAVRTLKTVFPAVSVWTEEEAGGNRTTYMVIAGRTPAGATVLKARHGISRVWRAWPANDLAARIDAARPPVLSDDFAPVDRLLSHILLPGDFTGR